MRCVWSGVCVGDWERGALRVGGWRLRMQQPATRCRAHARDVVWVWAVRAPECAQAPRCLLKALSKVPRPPGSPLPPSAGTRGWQREGWQEGRNWCRGATQRGAGRWRRGESASTYPSPPLALCRAGAEPSARGGGPTQLGPAWGGDRSCGDPLAAHGERVEWERGGCGPESPPPQPRGPYPTPQAPCGRRGGGVHGPRPHGARRLPSRLPWPRAPGAASSRVAPSRSRDPDRGNSFPLTSSSKMQKISDFDR